MNPKITGQKSQTSQLLFEETLVVCRVFQAFLSLKKTSVFVCSPCFFNIIKSQLPNCLVSCLPHSYKQNKSPEKKKKKTAFPVTSSPPETTGPRPTCRRIPSKSVPNICPMSTRWRRRSIRLAGVKPFAVDRWRLDPSWNPWSCCCLLPRKKGGLFKHLKKRWGFWKDRCFFFVFGGMVDFEAGAMVDGF